MPDAGLLVDTGSPDAYSEVEFGNAILRVIKMGVLPTKLEQPTANVLRIAWSDGMVREYGVRELRDACPCATCREKRSAPPLPPNVLPVIPPGAGGPLTIASMRPTGNYAYNIAFSDGHDSGLYTLDLLRTLGAEMP